MARPLSRTDNEIAEIYKRHIKTVYGICYSFMKNRVDTDDAVSETFIKMIKAAPSFESQEHEKAWLIRTATNVCKNMLTHWQRRLENLEDYANRLQTESSFEPSGTLTAISRLPSKYKAVVYLFYYEGYTSAQCSKILRKPHSTIRYFLQEARESLKQTLGGEFNEE